LGAHSLDEYNGGWQSDTLTSADLAGKPVVLNFWASWCRPCEEEAEILEQAWQRYKDQGVMFVAWTISIRSPRQSGISRSSE